MLRQFWGGLILRQLDVDVTAFVHSDLTWLRHKITHHDWYTVCKEQLWSPQYTVRCNEYYKDLSRMLIVSKNCVSPTQHLHFVPKKGKEKKNRKQTNWTSSLNYFALKFNCKLESRGFKNNKNIAKNFTMFLLGQFWFSVPFNSPLYPVYKYSIL